MHKKKKNLTKKKGIKENVSNNTYLSDTSLYSDMASFLCARASCNSLFCKVNFSCISAISCKDQVKKMH